MSSPTKSSPPGQGSTSQPASNQLSSTSTNTSSDTADLTSSSALSTSPPKDELSTSPPESSPSVTGSVELDSAPTPTPTSTQTQTPTISLPLTSSNPPLSSPNPTPISLPSASPPVLAPVSATGGPMSPPPANGSQPSPTNTNRAIPLPQGKLAGSTIRKLNRSTVGASPYPGPPPTASALSHQSTHQPHSQQTQPPTSSHQQQQPQQQQQQQQHTPQFPALHLTPLNDTFVPKQISLSPVGSKVKIGRQTNAKTVPNGTNGFFDSKVLSRMHAEVWSDEGKVFIKDVKSSNGTFINGVRLSQEGQESDLFELHSEDVVEFGIDIVSEDNKTIVHHKVAAKVYLVMNQDDALVSSREFSNWYRTAGEGAGQVHRRGPSKPVNTQPASSGLSFEHVLSRLQGELQKSRDTSTNLGDLTSTLGEVHDTLGGGAPPPMPAGFAIPANGRLPPAYGNPASNKERDQQAQTIAALQSQLNDTQNSLASHVGQMRDLEGLLAEHDGIKREVGTLRMQMVDAQRDMETMLSARLASAGVGSGGHSDVTDGRESPVAAQLEAEEDEDDARSIASVETISHARANGIRAVNGDHHDEADEDSPKAEQQADVLARERQLQEQNARLAARLETLSVELDEATKLGQALRSQHAEAAQAIRTLEHKVKGLELAVEGAAARESAAGELAATEVDARWDGWRRAFEASWQQERRGWAEEREKLVRVVEEWEGRKERRERRRQAREADDSSSEEEEEEDDHEGEEEDALNELDGSAGGVGPAKAKKRAPATRRRRRPTATQADIATLSSPTLSGTTKVASDSDDTIGSGERSGGQGQGHRGEEWRGAAAVGGGGDRAGRKGEGVSYPAAGAMVLVAAAVAVAMSVKLRE